MLSIEAAEQRSAITRAIYMFSRVLLFREGCQHFTYVELFLLVLDAIFEVVLLLQPLRITCGLRKADSISSFGLTLHTKTSKEASIQAERID
jgi:hypothetical protein